MNFIVRQRAGTHAAQLFHFHFKACRSLSELAEGPGRRASTGSARTVRSVHGKTEAALNGIPTKAGIQAARPYSGNHQGPLDSRFRGNDEIVGLCA